MATNSLYVGQMDWEWEAGHLTIIVGMGAGHLPTIFQMPGVCPGVCPGGGMLAAGIDSHIKR